jgi:hypothetical protein
MSGQANGRSRGGGTSLPFAWHVQQPHGPAMRGDIHAQVRGSIGRSLFPAHIRITRSARAFIRARSPRRRARIASFT